MPTPSLIRVRCLDAERAVGLVNYADMLVYDQEKNVVAVRIGGYPETVQAMSDAILGGCELELTGSKSSLCLSSKGRRNYARRISHDGVYAEGIHWLQDDSLQSLAVGQEDDDPKSEKETVSLKRNLYIFCTSSAELFDELDRKLSVPLLPEFRGYFLSELKKRGLLDRLKVYCPGRKFQCWHMSVSKDESEIAQILEDGLKDGSIAIPGSSPGQEDVFRHIASFTAYLREFGDKIAGRIKDCFPPRFNPAEEAVSPPVQEVNRYVVTHAGYSLFDAQLGAAEALKRQLETDRLALLVAECGTGKSKIGAAALYAYQHSRADRRTARKAFNVVVCPSHLTGKWVRELHETVPDCLAQYVTSIQDIDLLYNRYQGENKTVFCILSKETARNGYMRQPAVTWNRRMGGFICPDCGRVQEMRDPDTSSWIKADALFFQQENSHNHRCRFCGASLWTVQNPDELTPKRTQWVRIGGYGYVHRRFAYQAAQTCKKAFRAKIEEVVERPDGLFPAAGAYRRYPLSAYLKKKLKRIDALIVDELHQYSGESAQGQAMAELAGIADKVLGMTATLVNGYAKGIFYLLFRLKARLMLLDNQAYKRPRDFCLQYGVLEEMYEEDTTEYNSTSKSRKRKVRERFLPGVSPIVYSRFLLENAVFLSLNDMGKELPDYEEIPIPCTMLPEVQKEYDALQNNFRHLMRKAPRIGKRVMSAYLNLLSAYPDQPYGHEPIRNPFVEEEGMNVLSAPKDIGSADDLQPKDEVLLDLIDRKIQAGERVIVYTAWVRLDTQERLHKLLTEKGVKAAILDQKVPTVQREEWVDKRVREEVKVLITNSALVETGLDLNAFTTLIFYNIAFNLYVFRQASRRSWRINQTAPKVEIYMLYYADTMQHKALRLMASKLSAATVIEGQITDEGLAAMSDCQDLTTQLAKELMRGLKDDVEDLAASFKKMAIIGNRPKPAVAEKPSAPAEPEKQLLPVQQPILLPVPPCSETKRAGAKDTGQVSIFDLLAS